MSIDIDSTLKEREYRELIRDARRYRILKKLAKYCSPKMEFVILVDHPTEDLDGALDMVDYVDGEPV